MRDTRGGRRPTAGATWAGGPVRIGGCAGAIGAGCALSGATIDGSRTWRQENSGTNGRARSARASDWNGRRFAGDRGGAG